jgi:hypothetical protein
MPYVASAHASGDHSDTNGRTEEAWPRQQWRERCRDENGTGLPVGDTGTETTRFFGYRIWVFLQTSRI